MNDSKVFMDTESICSGNPHVTSPPGLFPRHPPFEGMLRPSFISQRQDESRQISGIYPVYQETFLRIHKILRQLHVLRN